MPQHTTTGEVVAWDQEDELADRILKMIPGPENPGRKLLALAGVPASGKSTLAEILCRRVNVKAGGEVCIVVGMDGFHLTRNQLSAMENAEKAHQRRGAEWTFDANAFGGLLNQISTTTDTVIAPSFDHAAKDPVPHGVKVEAHHRLVIVEGLYVLLDQPPWNDAVLPHFEKGARWFLDCPMELCKSRIIPRHVKAGISRTIEEAAERWENNDGVNATLIRSNLSFVDLWLVPPSASKL